MAKEQKFDNACIFIPTGFFLGFGLGFVFDDIPAGIFLGLGAGFLLYALIKNMRK